MMNDKIISGEYSLDIETLNSMRAKEWLERHSVDVSPHIWQDTTPIELERMLFNHGFISGRKYDFNYYIPRFDKLRTLGVPINQNEYPFPFHWGPCIAQEMAGLLNRLPREQSMRMMMLIQQRNPHKVLEELVGERNLPAFFKRVQEKYHLQSTTPSDFWKYYETGGKMDLENDFGALFKGKQVLDLGGGARSYQYVHTAADMARESLQENTDAQYKIQIEDINKCLSEGRSLPFQDRSYGAITLNFVVNFIDNTEGLYSECKRILIPNGVLLVVETPLKGEYAGKLFEKRGYDPKRTVDELKGLGFSVTRQQISGTIPDYLVGGDFKNIPFSSEAVVGSLGRLPALVSWDRSRGKATEEKRGKRKREREARKRSRKR